MHKILVIRLYMPVYADTSGCCVAIARQQHMLAYTKCDVQLIKVAPDDGLIQSETCRASNGK